MIPTTGWTNILSINVTILLLYYKYIFNFTISMFDILNWLFKYLTTGVIGYISS